MDLQTFEENKNANSNLVSKTEKYYKSIYTDLNGNSYSTEVTKAEYDNQGNMNQRGTLETDYKYIVSTLSQNGNQFRYKLSVMWKRMPATKSYDIIGIGFDKEVYIDSPIYFNYYMCDSSGNCGTYSDYYNKKVTSTGATTVFKFPSAANNSLSLAMWYDVSKNTTNTITSLAMYGDYSHATSSVSASSTSNHRIDYDGILLGSNIYGSYDATPCVVSVWNGTW